MKNKLLIILPVFIILSFLILPEKTQASCPLNCSTTCVRQCDCGGKVKCTCCESRTRCTHNCGDGGDGGTPTPKSTISGGVWKDFNGNGTRSNDELWGRNNNCDCVEHNYISSHMQVTYAGTNVTWKTNGDYPHYEGKEVDVGSSQTVTLTPPSGVDCSWISWSYTKCGDSACTAAAQTHRTGNGCSMTIGSVGEFGNRLWWRITPKVSIMGVVWQNFGGTSGWDWSDSWSRVNTCTTHVDTSRFNVSYAGANAGWNCAGGFAAYSGVAVDWRTNQTVNLTPPTGYDCNEVSWSATKCGDAACTESLTDKDSGSGCTVPVTGVSEFSNHVWYKITPVVRNISGFIYSTDGGGNCTSKGNLNIAGLGVTAYNNASPRVTIGSSNVNNGIYSISPLSKNQAFGRACVTGSVVSGNNVYVLDCVSQIGLTGTTVVTGQSCVNVQPTNALLSNNVTLNFGFKQYNAEKWFTSIDGDIYGNGITAYVATAPQPGSGFKPNVIINSSATTSGGYGLSASSITTQTPGTSISAKGGGASNLGNASVDKWLHSFVFKAPTHTSVNTTLPSSNIFAAGTVYRFTSEQVNTILGQGAYTITGTAGQPKLAIIYVEDTRTTLNFSAPFKSANPTDILIIISAAPVNIAANLSVPDLTTFTSTSASQIDAIIVTRASINTNSLAAGTTFDLPIVIGGGLYGRTQLLLNRELGGFNNSLYPAEVVNYYGSALAKIIDYEMANTATSGYTGLTTFDTQWVYSQ